MVLEETVMQTMNISLPEPLKEFVDQQIAHGRYSSISEYVRELIREDEKRKAQLKLENMLLEGINSPAKKMEKEDWNNLKKQVREQLSKRQAK